MLKKAIEDMIDKQIKKQFGNWTAFSIFQKRNPKNFKRTFNQNIDKINKWLEPLDLHIVFKKGAKKIKEN